jgi:hypothetical protein
MSAVLSVYRSSRRSKGEEKEKEHYTQVQEKAFETHVRTMRFTSRNNCLDERLSHMPHWCATANRDTDGRPSPNTSTMAFTMSLQKELGFSH